MKLISSIVLAVVTLLGSHLYAAAYTLSDPSGLGAEVVFTLLDPTHLQIELTNTSTGVPAGFSNSDQLLTGVSFDLGALGAKAGDPAITGGTVKIGAASESMNFDTGSYGPATDVSGEWGFGNGGGSGCLPNLVVAMTAQADPFSDVNLDGPESLDGPQGGLIAASMPVDLGGLGAIKDEVIITVLLDRPLSNLNCLDENFVRVEFGSDAAFITTPEPASIVITAVAAFMCLPSRRRLQGARVAAAAVLLGVSLNLAAPASAASYSLSDSAYPGLAAQVDFTLQDGGSTLKIVLTNTSTGAPAGFSNSDQLLTSVSFDFGAPGANAGEPAITDGTVAVGPSSQSINFSILDRGPGEDVSGEWGYGNGGESGMLTNLVCAMTAQTEPFGDVNLDGPESLDGPQAGLMAAFMTDQALGGMGAIKDEVIITLTLSKPLNDLCFLDENFVRVEFGSDAAFITTPEPATLVMTALAGYLCLPRRRHQ